MIAKTTPETECVNLKTRFGDRFKVRYEESYQAERGENAWKQDPWLLVIPCTRKGWHIYSHGGDLLGVATVGSRGEITKRLLALDCVTITQDGDDGVNVIFPVDRFEDVAEIVKPRRRRRGMTPEERQVAADRLRDYQFRPAEKRRKSDLESPAGE